MGVVQVPAGMGSPPPVQVPPGVFAADIPMAKPLQPTVETAFMSLAAQRSEFTMASRPLSAEPLSARVLVSAVIASVPAPASLFGTGPPHATRTSTEPRARRNEGVFMRSFTVILQSDCIIHRSAMRQAPVDFSHRWDTQSTP